MTINRRKEDIMATGYHRIIMKIVLTGSLFFLGSSSVHAGVLVQCPGDADGSATWTGAEVQPAHTKCMHLGAGDGFVTMADGKLQYVFGFSDLTGIAANTPTGTAEILEAGTTAAGFPAPLIVLDEGDEFYLTLTNIGMSMRPDLFDPHTVHFHGFPQAASIFDGVPDASISINMGSSLTYYFKLNNPGTYMYHCHVEAAEHMQMGMLGSLYVRAAQNGTVFNYNGKDFNKFAYNDGDGSTGYDLEYPIQIGSFDSAFHDANLAVQPLPFATMFDNYSMLNGRGYPDTVNPNPLPPPAENGGKLSQIESTLITASPGESVLLRISNLNVTRMNTLATLGIPMRVIGKDAKQLRGPDGKNLYYKTNSITVGGGESYDVILDIPAGASGKTYFLYTTQLHYLSNDAEQFGGMMTEIRIN
ncbi:MAG TPA: multicopper oxidase family protein [Desulfobulbaceae bacterium]|nr:multicopper oxidase family protein [Desulfobulbaceae bacterium]